MQFLLQLKRKYDKLTEGKYGFDTLGRDMMILWVIIGFLNRFIRSRIVEFAALVLPVLALLRVFSEAVYKRSNENRKYLEIREKVFQFVKIHFMMIKESKTHRYYKCKNCSSYIRVKRKKGEHYVDCPKCGKEIKVKIR